MKKRLIGGTGAALLVAAVFISWAWAAGFNFDHRDEHVGEGFIMAMICILGAGFITYSSIDDKTK